MWLLVKYYSAYVILRQRFLTSGEASVNEWQEQYMQSSLDKRGKEEGKGVLAALKHFKQLFDPSEVRPVTASHQCKQVVTQPMVAVSYEQSVVTLKHHTVMKLAAVEVVVFSGLPTLSWVCTGLDNSVGSNVFRLCAGAGVVGSIDIASIIPNVHQ